MKKRYLVTCTIVEFDDNFEVVEDGYNASLDFEIDTDQVPVIALKHAIQESSLDASDFCT